jgi:HPt (histidine-containing phosphotransfer) domain-containing protein
MPPEVTIDKTQELEELPKPDPKETLAVKLRAAFVESLPERIEEISIYMKHKNCHELGRIFHGIKGSAGYLKDEQLESLAGGLEVLADANNISEIEESLSNFMGLLVTYR